MANTKTNNKRVLKRKDRTAGHTAGYCVVCDIQLTKIGGYEQTDMCGPCCTGEAATFSEMGETWQSMSVEPRILLGGKWFNLIEAMSLIKEIERSQRENKKFRVRRNQREMVEHMIKDGILELGARLCSGGSG